MTGQLSGLAKIAASGFKVVVDYSYGSTSFVMPNILSKLGVRDRTLAVLKAIEAGVL